MFAFRAALIVTLLSIALPMPALSGSYQARCASKRECTVKILADRMIVEGKVIPVDAIASWAKGGPGSQSNPVLGAGATILFGAPGLLAFGLRSFKSTFSIAYYSPEGEIKEVAFAFHNGDQSRFFETEIQAATGLPIGKVKREAKDFNWKSSDFSDQR
jgi:hypothetical protein